MSKFDCSSFYGSYDDFAINKERYSKEEAIEVYKKEMSYLKGRHKFIAIGEGFVRHRAGINEDNEPCVGWWLEYKQHKRSCPVWVFHTTFVKDETFKDYEYIEF